MDGDELMATDAYPKGGSVTPALRFNAIQSWKDEELYVQVRDGGG